MNRKLSGKAMALVWLVANIPSWGFVILGIVGVGVILAWCYLG